MNLSTPCLSITKEGEWIGESFRSGWACAGPKQASRPSPRLEEILLKNDRFHSLSLEPPLCLWDPPTFLPWKVMDGNIQLLYSSLLFRMVCPLKLLILTTSHTCLQRADLAFLMACRVKSGSPGAPPLHAPSCGSWPWCSWCPAGVPALSPTWSCTGPTCLHSYRGGRCWRTPRSWPCSPLVIPPHHCRCR